MAPPIENTLPNPTGTTLLLRTTCPTAPLCLWWYPEISPMNDRMLNDATAKCDESQRASSLSAWERSDGPRHVRLGSTRPDAGIPALLRRGRSTRCALPRHEVDQNSFGLRFGKAGRVHCCDASSTRF